MPRAVAQADLWVLTLVFKDGPNPEAVKIYGDYPVFYVSYFDALAYVAWLNDKTGSDAYRLPTEAEWEYAARAGTQTTFPQGNTLTSNQANFSKQLTEFVMREKLPHLQERGMPVEVDEMNAVNAWGLRHIVGNASEITASCYTERLSDLPTTSAWLVAAHDTCEKRVERGGGLEGANGCASLCLARTAKYESSHKHDELPRSQIS